MQIYWIVVINCYSFFFKHKLSKYYTVFILKHGIYLIYLLPFCVRNYKKKNKNKRCCFVLLCGGSHPAQGGFLWQKPKAKLLTDCWLTSPGCDNKKGTGVNI